MWGRSRLSLSAIRPFVVRPCMYIYGTCIYIRGGTKEILNESNGAMMCVACVCSGPLIRTVPVLRLLTHHSRAMSWTFLISHSDMPSTAFILRWHPVCLQSGVLAIRAHASHIACIYSRNDPTDTVIIRPQDIIINVPRFRLSYFTSNVHTRDMA